MQASGVTHFNSKGYLMLTIAGWLYKIRRPRHALFYGLTHDDLLDTAASCARAEGVSA